MDRRQWVAGFARLRRLHPALPSSQASSSSPRPSWAACGALRRYAEERAGHWPVFKISSSGGRSCPFLKPPIGRRVVIVGAGGRGGSQLVAVLRASVAGQNELPHQRIQTSLFACAGSAGGVWQLAAVPAGEEAACCWQRRFLEGGHLAGLTTFCNRVSMIMPGPHHLGWPACYCLLSPGRRHSKGRAGIAPPACAGIPGRCLRQPR